MREEGVTPQGPWTDGQQGAISHQVKASVISQPSAAGTMFLCLPSPHSPNKTNFSLSGFFSFLTLLFIYHHIMNVSPGRDEGGHTVKFLHFIEGR